LIPAVHLDRFSHEHRRFRLLLAEFLFTESQQWLTWVQRPMPYSFRYRATTWAWSPNVHGQHLSHAICLRCGQMINWSRKPSPKAPLCAHCVKERNSPWPKHAIAPAGRGRWYLRCNQPACTVTFEGAGQRRYCDDHQLSKQTVSRRTARTAE
jgi:hypothetical protein